ncbi:MAG: alpha/beta hydrolase fold protein [Dehalococcoidia bacterium]|nr:alpha/beta hydrolase fold protein [Dehalococcoidia bacterium]
MTSRYIDINGVNIHYVALGQGQPLMFVSGLGASVQMSLDTVIRPLAERFQVYGLDLPGGGESDKPPISYTLEYSLKTVLDFMDALSIKTISVVGSSMGGLVSLGLALEHSNRVDKLVLVDSVGLGREVGLIFRLASLPILGEILGTPWLPAIKMALRSSYRSPPVDVDALAREFHRIRSLPGAKRALLLVLRYGLNFKGLKKHLVMRDRLPELRLPTLIMWGKNDPIFPVKHAYAAHQLIPNSRLHIFPECGHDPARESQEEFLKVISEFLEGE